MGKNLPPCHFIKRVPHKNWPGTYLRGKKPATNRLSHGIDLARFWNYRPGNVGPPPPPPPKKKERERDILVLIAQLTLTVEIVTKVRECKFSQVTENRIQSV